MPQTTPIAVLVSGCHHDGVCMLRRRVTQGAIANLCPAETVTYVLEGEMQHKDSAGNHGVLKEGWVQVLLVPRAQPSCSTPVLTSTFRPYSLQWMTAGSGLVHSETPGPEMMRTGGKQEGFQLWVNLPKKDKWVPPRYQDTPAKNMPVVALPADAGTVKVVAGSFEGHASVIETRIPIVYMVGCALRCV